MHGKKIRTSANSNAVYLIIVRRDLHFSPITIKMLNESISQEKKSTLNKIMTNDCVLNDSVICVFPWHCLSHSKMVITQSHCIRCCTV